ncbi:MAG TPA: thiol reductant ABC exporter subunit CydC [Candidatus Avamphibacillus sp.]|nr:thiol reductant ABC exporter subunit CydC [Candidatus Avamphibacillus sp.]
MSDWIKPYMKQNKGRIALGIFFGLLGIASGAMLLFVSGYLISKSSLRPENIMIVYVPIVSVRAFSIGQAVFVYLEKLVSHDIVLRILEKMRSRLYKIVEPQALFLSSRYQTGDLLGVLSDDIEHLQDFYIRTIFPSILGLVTYGTFAVVLGIFDWVFALLMLLMLGVLIFFMPLLSLMITRRHHIKQKQRINGLYSQLTDAIFGQVDWQASGRTDEIFAQVNTNDEQFNKTENQLRKWKHSREAVLRLMAGLVIIAIMIWTDIQTGAGKFSPTVIAAFVLMTFSITDALLPVSEAVEHVPSYMDSLARIEKVEDETSEQFGERETDFQNSNDITMALRNVSYQYPGHSTKAIDNLSLTITPGKKIAVLGKSGTGKSTLLKLMAGVLEPDEGKVSVNKTQMSSELLSKAVSVLNQKPHLFDTSIKNNIRMGRPRASDEELFKVIERAQLTNLISSLPEGLATQMEEMGGRFSGGERQRIAFARVLLQNTPIILFDEPTIGLDPITEQEVLNTILTATKDKTVIWVTHHLAGVEHMDEVIFLDDGKIAMQGTHEELLKTNKRYQKLYRMDQGVEK